MTTEFISLIFTRWASRRLSYAALLRVRSKKNYDVTLRRLVERSEIPPSGPIKASDSCKIQVTNDNLKTMKSLRGKPRSIMFLGFNSLLSQ